jgi:phosphoglucosamine mutase
MRRSWVDSGGSGPQGADSTMPAAATSSSARARCRHSLSLRGLKIVVDGAHGAAYHVAPDVFHELGADVVSIGCSPMA